MQSDESKLAKLWHDCSFCLREVASNPKLQDSEAWDWTERAAFLQVRSVRKEIERLTEETGGSGFTLTASYAIEILNELEEWGGMKPYSVSQLAGGLIDAVERAGQFIEAIDRYHDVQTEAVIFVRGTDIPKVVPQLSERSTRSRFLKRHKVDTKKDFVQGKTCRDVYVNYAQLREACLREYQKELPIEPPSTLRPKPAKSFGC